MSNQVSINSALDKQIGELESKAARVKQSKNTADRVDSARGDVGRVSRRLDDVVEKTEELWFYIQLYEQAFGEKRPGNIQPRIRTALDKVEVSDEELLTAARDERLADIEDQVEAAESQVENAIGMIRDALEEEQARWISKLDSARELNKIIGGDSDFQDLISRMRGFLSSEMWNPGVSPAQLATKWERFEAEWEENSGKHGWDTFQRDHDLNDSTVDELKQFGDDKPVRLSDLSLQTLEEIKRVPELESALQLEVRS